MIADRRRQYEAVAVGQRTRMRLKRLGLHRLGPVLAAVSQPCCAKVPSGASTRRARRSTGCAARCALASPRGPCPMICHPGLRSETRPGTGLAMAALAEAVAEAVAEITS